MQTLLFAALVSVAIADNACTLHAQTLHAHVKKVELTCSIPSATMISPECCGAMQGLIDKGANEVLPSQQEQLEAMHSCSAFAMYVENHMPQDPAQVNTPEGLNRVLNTLPDGLSCTETVSGEGESACGLHAQQGKLGVTCEVPASTTITSECCSAVQSAIDTSLKMEQLSPQQMEEGSRACQGFVAYVSQHTPQVPPGATPAEQFEETSNSLPGGLTCTEAISGGDMLSLYTNHPVFSAIGLAAGVVSTARTDVSQNVSAVPFVASGIAGFLVGGMLMAGALLRHSKQQRETQQPLLTEPEVA